MLPDLKCSEAFKICKFLPTIFQVLEEQLHFAFLKSLNNEVFLKLFKEGKTDEIEREIRKKTRKHRMCFRPELRKKITKKKAVDAEIRYFYFEKPVKEFSEIMSKLCIIARKNWPSEEEIQFFKENSLKAETLFKYLFDSTIIPSMHQLTRLAPLYLEKWGSIGIFSQEGPESSNKKDLKVWEISKGGFS